MECWNIGVFGLNPFLHYSITPVFRSLQRRQMDLFNGLGDLFPYSKDLVIELRELLEVGSHNLGLYDEIPVHPELRKTFL